MSSIHLLCVGRCSSVQARGSYGSSTGRLGRRKLADFVFKVNRLGRGIVPRLPVGCLSKWEGVLSRADGPKMELSPRFSFLGNRLPFLRPMDDGRGVLVSFHASFLCTGKASEWLLFSSFFCPFFRLPPKDNDLIGMEKFLRLLVALWVHDRGEAGVAEDSDEELSSVMAVLPCWDRFGLDLSPFLHLARRGLRESVGPGIQVSMGTGESFESFWVSSFFLSDRCLRPREKDRLLTFSFK